MTDVKALAPALLCLALLSGSAQAVGLGDIALLSPIGEPLRAVVPVTGADKSWRAECFSLAPTGDGDLPVVSEARIRLARIGENFRLVIVASKPISEPVIVVKLRVGCGVDLQRDYVLLPGPPTALAVAAQDISRPSTGELVPRALAAADAATAGRTEPPRRIARRHPPRRDAAPAAPTGDASRPPTTLSGLANGRDRIILGSALDDLPAPAAGPALDERLLKMETSLHLLNYQVDKLNQALTLGREAQALHDRLRHLQGSSGLALAAPVAATASAEPASHPDAVGWLELLLGVVIGGSVSAGVAHLVSRRHDRRGATESLLPAGHITKPRTSA